MKEDKESLQTQIATVMLLSVAVVTVTMVTLTDSTAELGAGGQPAGEH